MKTVKPVKRVVKKGNEKGDEKEVRFLWGVHSVKELEEIMSGLE